MKEMHCHDKKKHHHGTDVVGGNRWVGILCSRDDVTLAFLLKKLILHAIDEAHDDDDSCVEACGTCLMWMQTLGDTCPSWDQMELLFVTIDSAEEVTEYLSELDACFTKVSNYLRNG